MKAKKATILKNGKTIILISPEEDVNLDLLIAQFGELTLKVSTLDSPILSIIGRGGLENKISPLDDIRTLDWEDINL